MTKPNHAARAVDIATCFPPLDVAGRDSATQRKAAEASAQSKSAKPMDTGARINAFWTHAEATGRTTLTARQHRQISRMERRSMRQFAA